MYMCGLISMFYRLWCCVTLMCWSVVRSA